MKQPYIYTLPQQFIDDAAVPMHWKLYAIINGFWISAKPVFASNAFFAKNLKCSERYVRDCLEKLEAMEVITREGQSQNRRIVPGSARGGTSSSSQFRGGGTSSSTRAEPAVPHTSDSISDRVIPEAKASVNSQDSSEGDSSGRITRAVDDYGMPIEDPVPQKKAGVNDMYWELLRWSETKRGQKFMNPRKQFKAFGLARKMGLRPSQLTARYEEFEIDKFRIEHGFDWMDVAMSFDKRPAHETR